MIVIKNRLNNVVFIPIMLICIFFLSSCSTRPPLRKELRKDSSSMSLKFPGMNQPVTQNADNKPVTNKEDEGPDSTQKNKIEDEPVEVKIIPFAHNEYSIQEKTKANSLFSSTKKVSVAVDEMEIIEFIHHVFGEILKINYIIDPKIVNLKKVLSLNIKNEITEAELFEIVKDILTENQLFIYEKKKIFYITNARRSESISIGIGSDCSDIPEFIGKIKQIIPIRYTDVNSIFSFVSSAGVSSIFPANDGNFIIVEGLKDQICHIMQILKILDTPTARSRNASLFRIKYSEIDGLIDKLKELLEVEGIPLGKKGVHLSNLSRWNALLCFAQEKNWVERVKYWINVLDIPADKEDKRYFTYFTENTRAEDLVETLNSLLGSSGAGAKSTGKGVTASEKNKKSEIADKNVISSVVGNDINITASGSSLIVYSTSADFKKIEELLTKIDILPVQVMIEVLVAEVTLKDDLSYGIEWALKNKDATSTLSTLGGLGLGSGGLAYSLTANSNRFQLAMNAMAKKQLLKIVSSPWLTVRDGKTATINVGTQVPVVTSEATSPEVQKGGNSAIIRSVQYRSTGVNLSVTPTVHSFNKVTLEISQEVSEAQTNDSSTIDSPMILNRSIITEVVATDKRAVILGGMISENKSTSKSRVPFLAGIPIIGNFFKTKSKGINRTELVVVIVPHILKSTQEVDEIKKQLINEFNYLDFE